MFDLLADAERPVINPAFVVTNWGDAHVKVNIGEKALLQGKHFRFGHRHTLEGTDLIVWLEIESKKTVHRVYKKVMTSRIQQSMKVLYRLYPGNELFLASLACVALLCWGCASLHHHTPDSPVAPFAADAFLIVGYAPDYSMERIAPGAYERVTDVILFSAELTEDGAFPEDGIAALPVARFQEIKQEHNARVHLCFGGWGRSGGFPEMTGDAAKRKAFINALLQWCLDNGFDGVDYDWEFPANRKEHAAYSRLLVETAEAFRPHGLRTTVAIGHTQRLEQSAYDAVDAIHLMTYDMGKRHATKRDATSSMRRLVRSGAPKEKIVLGVPFYGRRMDDRDMAMAYSHIMEQYKPQADEDEAGGFYFNNIETIRRKTRYAMEEGLAGIMIWELSMDTDAKNSLLQAIDEERRGNSATSHGNRLFNTQRIK